MLIMISFLTDKLRKITVFFNSQKLRKIRGKNWWKKLVKTSDEFVIRWEKKLQTMSYSCKRKQQVVSSVELSSESKVLLLMEAFCFFLSPSMVAAFLIKKTEGKIVQGKISYNIIMLCDLQPFYDKSNA